MADYIFLIGPGGAGKSTVGKILSATLGYNLIDLDDEFCEKIMNIRDYIHSYGYGSYLEKNSALLEGLLNQRSGDNILFILSSGFLSTDIRSDIVDHNRKLINIHGFSVLLMPSRHYEEALECILDRQLNRGFSLVREREKEKFSLRFREYLDMGNLKIFSMEAPESIAYKIANQLGQRSAY
ncbi:MAG: shikimate kinase [Serratia proteamaculans]|jgi:shikimate kinase|uniref:shikimate kinase n=1 Tax=Serratia proteamaculans TaxID=28151 RepID=UPI00217A1C9C|nr:shikimate kinase [Serratia proteamaculans]CAI0775184.1 Shikimate kinase 2 [Serratia proteamaculans]CAI1858089.1 Shikimate kinase 2 [Serratia proteamaculans]